MLLTVKPIIIVLDAHVNGHQQAPSSLVYLSLPSNKSKLLIFFVIGNDVYVICEEATMIRSC